MHFFIAALPHFLFGEFRIKTSGYLMLCRNMAAILRFAATWLVLINLGSAQAHSQRRPESATHSDTLAIWSDPADINIKDLFNGPGGEKQRPQFPVRFLKEDKHGHNSKFDV